MRRWRTGMAVFVILILSWIGADALAAVRMDGRPCHAVTRGQAPPPARFDCRGPPPQGYSHATLWLRAGVDGAAAGEPVTLFLYRTRFRGLAVAFDYADGRRIWMASVAPGAYRDSLRIGGEFAFDAPPRASPVRAVTLRIDGLADFGLLRVQLLDHDEAERAASLLAALVGGALTLLAIGAFYSASLALATRQPFLAWHAGWALSVLVWGALWSQFAGMRWPLLSGAIASQLCTALSTLACFCATACAMTPIPDRCLSRPVRWAVVGVGAMELALGLWAATITDEGLALAGSVLAVSTLVNLVVVFVAVLVAWRRGSAEAKAFALAWAPPMAAVGLTQCVNLDSWLYGGGPQILVLIVCALQTAWLAIATTLRLARLRVERDLARAAQRELDELSRRDSLTGLLNRRGLIAAAEEMRVAAGGLCLLLIDLDHFKAINDGYGHDVGDAVLREVGRLLAGLEEDGGVVGRLGGEEFVFALPHLPPEALLRFAERVRAAVAAHEPAAPCRVTVSIGVASGGAGQDFQAIYKAADLGLYEAKKQGRNRVVVRPAIRFVAGDGERWSSSAG